MKERNLKWEHWNKIECILVENLNSKLQTNGVEKKEWLKSVKNYSDIWPWKKGKILHWDDQWL
jgi:hypothetical protein